MARQLHAIVAGAGIGGLLAAVVLARAGARVTVLERARVLEEAGAGLQLAPNATRCLENLGILDRVSAFASAPELLRIRRGRDGRDLVRLPLGPIADFRWGGPWFVIHRADLQRVLVEACATMPGIAIRTGLAVSGFAQSSTGVEVGARAGDQIERFSGDFLIGADGLRSLVRAHLGLGAADAPVWSGRTAWRALVPARGAPPHALTLAANLWLGPRAHLVHYPVRSGALVNVVAIAEDGWRGDDADDLWSVGAEPAEISPSFVNWCDEARALVIAAREWKRWPLFDRNPVRAWRNGRVALLGDAAHPMLPFLAQGAAQAIEDAAALGDAFKAHADDVTGALTAYEASRFRRAGAVVIASRRQGAVYHMRRPLDLGRDAVMRALGAEGMMKRMDWLYAEQP